MLARFRSRFIDVFDTEELVGSLDDLLPLSADGYKVVSIQGSVKKFTCIVNCRDIIKPNQFVKDFASKSNVTLRKSSPKYTKNDFSKQLYFRCQHNTRYQNHEINSFLMQIF